jgi:hypothetical protein
MSTSINILISDDLGKVLERRVEREYTDSPRETADKGKIKRDIVEAALSSYLGIDRTPLTKVERTVAEALTARGFSKSEAGQLISRLKGKR